MDKAKLERDVDAVIKAYNVAQAAQQKFSDAHVATEPDPISDELYEATYALCARLGSFLTSVEFQNIMLSIDSEAN